MTRNLDQIDERIVSELSQNARLSHSELAKKVHLSRNAVRQRIERLEHDGIIAGYTIIRGSHRSRPSTTAMIFVYRHDRMRGGDVLQALRRIPEVVTCDVLTGEFDLIVRVEAAEADQIRIIWQTIAALPGVKDTITAFALSSVVRRSANP